jgi:hypothetical protein
VTATNGALGGVELEAARILLTRLGITPEQLLATGAAVTPQAKPMPTFAEYIDRVSNAVTAGTRRVYDTYWTRVREVWGDRRLDEPTPLEVKQLAERVKAAAVVRSNSRGGRTAAEHLISALRCLYRYAVADGLIAEADNPAIRVANVNGLLVLALART